MTPELIQQLGDDLFAALRERRTLVPFTNRFSEITVEDAYGISLQFLNRRVAAGERVIGKKIGVTSKPVQDMLGVFQPDFGFLTDAMHCADGDRDQADHGDAGHGLRVRRHPAAGEAPQCPGRHRRPAHDKRQPGRKRDLVNREFGAGQRRGQWRQVEGRGE